MTYFYAKIFKMVQNLTYNFLLLLFISSLSIGLQAQINGVKFMLKPNSNQEQVDLYLIVTDGQTVNPIDRVQFNTQITFVIPKGLKPNVSKTYMPLNNNKNYDGTVPCKWKIMSFILAPEVTPDVDYYAVVPELHPTSFYNNLKPLDTIQLFTLEFKGAGACVHQVRLYDNTIDPKSDALGMNGADFFNTFTIGGTEHVYLGNTPNNLSLKLNISKDVISVNAKGKSYQWYRSGEDQIIDTTGEPRFSPSKSGKYYVKVISDLCEITSDEIAFKK